MAASKLSLAAVFVFHIVAFGLAIAAERRRSSGRPVPDEYDDQTYCVYDSDIASWYGTGAFIFLLISQALMMALSRCLCCGSPLKPGPSRVWAVALFILSWLCFVIAEACLVAGSVRNAYHTKYRAKFNMQKLSCATLRAGVFAAGASFTLINMILSICYILTFSRARSYSFHLDAQAQVPPKPYLRDPGVAMGHL